MREIAAWRRKQSRSESPSPRRGEVGRGAEFGHGLASQSAPTPTLPLRGRASRASRSATKLKNHRRGIFAEFLALFYLTLKGYWLVAQRYKTPVGEIDLILRRGKTLVFVEVKAREHAEDAAHAIHGKNQSRVVRAAQHFLTGHPAYQNFTVRFDAVLIAWYSRPHHLINAFGA